MQRVVRLQNSFPAVTQAPVAKEKSDAAQRQILLMRPRNPVADKNDAHAIVLAAPSFAIAAHADLVRLVHFGVRERFVLPFIPAPAPEDAEPRIDRLLEIDAETIFDGGLQ